MIVRKTSCKTLEEFQDVCHFIYGDVMKLIKNEKIQWYFNNSTFEYNNTWSVLFYNSKNKNNATKSLCLTVKYIVDDTISITHHYHEITN